MQLFKQDATSYYTQKIAENMGFITVFELRYKASVSYTHLTLPTIYSV